MTYHARTGFRRCGTSLPQLSSGPLGRTKQTDMRTLALITLASLFFSFPRILIAQQSKSTRDSVARTDIVPVPVPDDSTYPIHLRPKLSMQTALKLAENYIVKEHIDISPFFLYQVHLIQYGSEKGPKEQRWYFSWVSDAGTLGADVEITVSMEGKVCRLPSM